MKILLFCTNSKSKNIFVPVLDYFVCRYSRMNELQVIDDLSGILSKWKHVKDNNGQADGWYAKKQHGLDYIEIHVKKSNTLLRFPYYLDSKNNKMVILTGYEKIDNYNSGGKEDRQVNIKRQEAQDYYKAYHNDRSKEIELPKKFLELMNKI